MKLFYTLAAMTLSTCAFAQSYLLTVETFVGNKLEDKMSFSLQVGEPQTKGFDGKLLAKRYRAKGFPNKRYAEIKAAAADAKKTEAESKMTPREVVKNLAEKTRGELAAAERASESASAKIDSLSEKLKLLEELEELGSRNSPSFDRSYEAFCKKYELTPADLEYKKMLKKRPAYTGDIEEIDYGSFCSVKIMKAADKDVLLNINYAYSRIRSSFYSDGTNNSNSITKHPVVERFEKYGMKNVHLVVGKPYCVQFGRLSAEKARSLSEALSKSGIFGDGESVAGGEQAEAEADESAKLDAQGLYSEIKRKYSGEGGRVLRAVFTLKHDNGAL